jgi:hypothetical protein
MQQRTELASLYLLINVFQLKIMKLESSSLDLLIVNSPTKAESPTAIATYSSLREY